MALGSQPQAYFRLQRRGGHNVQVSPVVYLGRVRGFDEFLARALPNHPCFNSTQLQFLERGLLPKGPLIYAFSHTAPWVRVVVLESHTGAPRSEENVPP